MNLLISPRRLAVLAGIALLSPAFALVNIDYVSVGHGGNAVDPANGSLYGAVAYAYRIGKYEVTNAQYAEFLNSVDPAGANPNGIYDPNMGSDVRGGISFNAGAANGSKYTSRSSMGDKPVNWVSWRSAARFANWLHNGQGSGSTETGAYTMSANPVVRNVGATVFLPSENEWYKAAYYDSTPGAGGGDNYWTYATQSNTAPTTATANSNGDVTNPGANVQNYNNGADWNSLNGNLTTVGSALANNYFGTQDMGGNVREWLEDGANNREIRGTSFSGSAPQSSSGDVSTAPNTSVFVTHGFRVASPPLVLPAVTGVSPNTGATVGGTSVTLTGTHFTGASSVTFSGIAATNLVVVNATTITCTTPARAASSSSVLVTTPGGTNAANTLFTYLAPPEDRASPNGLFMLRFQSDGNVSVRRTSPDAYFWDAINSASWFSGIASNFVFFYQNGIIQRINQNSGALIDEHVIQVNVSGSTYIGVNNAGQVEIFPTDPTTVLPTLTNLSPNTGTTVGGTSVTLTGTYLTGATSVTFGGTAATSFNVVNGSTITCTTPAGAAGNASVQVTTPGGTNAANTLFTYVTPPPPTLTSVSPAAGTNAGGTSVTLTGTNFTGASTVTFGGNAATDLIVVNGTTITCTTPTSLAGPSSVLVTTPGGTNAANTLFTYAALPENRFSPDGEFELRFESNGNVVVRRTSTNSHFWDAINSASWFGATVGNSLFSYQNGAIQRINRTTGSVIDEHVIQANVSGCTYLGVNNSGGIEIISCNPATALPTITSVIPNIGSTAGATHVTLFGLNFTGATSVTFAGTAAMRFLVVNNNTITCNTPAGAVGTASVLVTTPVGTNAENVLFTYVDSSLESATPQAASFAIDANKNPVLQWQAETGRRYSIRYSPDLKNFTPIAEGFPFGGAISPSLEFKDIGIFTGTNPRGFYTVEKNSSSNPDSSVELDEFFAANRGKVGFKNNQVMALETLRFALDEIEAGQLDAARARINAMYAAYPLSTPGWDAGFGYRGLNMGRPVGYYGIRMLDQILTLGNPSRKGKLRMTAVIAPSAVVTRPTLPNLVPETVNLNLAPEILAEDARRLHLVTRLFRRWLQAITGGLEVELVVHVMNQGTTVNFVERPGWIESYPNSQAMVDSVPPSIANTTDLWWVIAPSGVPGDGTGFGKDFITGAMTGHNGSGSPMIVSDDAWFIRKPVHLGSGLYSEVELSMYHPMWFQHELMHNIFGKYPEFGLEAQGHQWNDRSTWPADFVGVNEPDYYAEALTKRILPITSPNSLADKFQRPDYADMAVFPVAKLVGSYRRNPVLNGFHEVKISLEGGNLRWTNAAGFTWGFEIIGSDLWSLPNSLYGAQKYRVQIDGDGNVIGINQGEFYRRNDYPQPPLSAETLAPESIMPMPNLSKPTKASLIECPGCSFHPIPE
jgi:formylglycine-generating enzyme required for sulfatase activity